MKSSWICVLLFLLGDVFAQSSFKPLTRPEELSLRWGPYRPGSYFGIRNRNLDKDTQTDGLIAGFMWYDGGWWNSSECGLHKMRDSCQQEDGLQKYGWNRADPKVFYDQDISDFGCGIKMRTSFVKLSGGNDWLATVHVDPAREDLQPRNLSVIFYASLDYAQSRNTLQVLEPPKQTRTKSGRRAPKNSDATQEDFLIRGYTTELGTFSLLLQANDSEGLSPATSFSYWGTDKDVQRGSWKAKELAQRALHEHGRELMDKGRRKRKTDTLTATYSIPSSVLGNEQHVNEQGDGGGNGLVMVQHSVSVPGTISVFFISHDAHKLESDDDASREAARIVKSEIHGNVETELATGRKAFDRKFEEVFHLKSKGFNKREVDFAMSSASNLIGAMGFFEGKWLVRDEPGKAEGEVGPSKLFSGVPSRPFFPRGFLWDEGFHELVVCAWDQHVCRDALSSWLNLMEPSGWIAREQILGDEARSRVPEQFRVQDRTVANPPSMLLSFAMLLKLHRMVMFDAHPGIVTMTKKQNDDSDSIDFLRQAYPRLKKQFEWYLETQKGEIEHTFRWRGRSADGRHTFASGLDDYPRAPVASDDERHVDLHSWMTFAAGLMSRFATTLGEKKDATKFSKLRETLQKNLDQYYWAEDRQTYCDYGVSYMRDVMNAAGNVESRQLGPRGYVCNEGYISLFPFMLQLIPADSPKLGAALKLISDPDKIWSDFGIRSLSKQSPYYGRAEDYWRGAIWVNLNYMTAAALKSYSEQDGPYRAQAAELYTALRTNLVRNIRQEYERTGFLWEQYAPDNGKGRRSHPFAGWTSLVVLVMAEMYPL
eukprot:TRINITY_DN5165_c0_g1::TRINITY_DN5165_c0_g1_i1::g.29373::m.29373 TRINITY_DN5165_c0_g1::TRINITY_DN5165_c0_g1_i1::g.29373  ORF type:complete len:823 (-),score=218.08,sp/Q80UM7/MOGS_MOUSE/35.28/2e-139,Glyco_hydro_63/PF03200.11/1.3e-221,Bac_rhamnosid/PF05592.6/4.6e-06,Bac_rhamnosid/PF05592.6/74,Trehalase/PF01204.13/2.9e-06,GDE_C/PF06202.9/4.2e+02,GDE_C/PF06202.9/0.03 TRINITY_DN5165_c0_g1_i1:57-2525(-)